MRCSCVLAVAVLCAAAARAENLRIVSAALLYETGLLAPSIELRSVAEDGASWRTGINGWTFGLDRERLLDGGRRLTVGMTVTPYNAHSSRRMFLQGTRVRDVEFNDAAVTASAGLRIRQGDHASIEPAIVVGKEWIGDNAASAVRDAWRKPYAGVAVAQRVRFVTADDPLAARLEGVDVTSRLEAYRGDRTWTRATITERAGTTIGRLHLHQSLAAFGGSELDTVSAFLVGGGWDLLGPFAVVGRRYAEFRLNRGIIGNGGADVAVGRGFALGVRGSAFRGTSTRASGAMLLVTRRAGGLRLTAGAARSGDSTTLTLTVAGAVFR